MVVVVLMTRDSLSCVGINVNQSLFNFPRHFTVLIMYVTVAPRVGKQRDHVGIRGQPMMLILLTLERPP